MACPPRQEIAVAVRETTIKEQQLGFLSDFKEAAKLDTLFGKGPVGQSCYVLELYQKDKYRPIDNGPLHQNLDVRAMRKIHPYEHTIKTETEGGGEGG